MKKGVSKRRLQVLILLILFILMECIWLIHTYHTEKQHFQKQINQAIRSAIEEETYSPKEQHVGQFFIDITSHKGRLIATFILEDQEYQIDTTAHLEKNITDRIIYDFCQANWNIDSLYHRFQHHTPYPQLPIIFARQSNSREFIDHTPAISPIPAVTPTFESVQLGNIHTEQIKAWYQYPVSHFWEAQKYGLIASLFPLLFALYYSILIIREEVLLCNYNTLLEKQTIFIHDLKVPLSTNQKIEERILKHINDWSSEKIYEKLKCAHSQSIQLLAELKRGIALSVEDRNKNKKIQSFDLKKSLSELIAHYQNKNKQVTITLDYQLDKPDIFGDSFHITHIVENLLSNAIKHTDEEINIQIICYTDAKNRLCIQVKDNGAGIPIDIQKHIFKVGFQITHSKSNHGLGLAYIQKILKMSKGYIRIDSEKKKGTTFSLCFYSAKTIQAHYHPLSPYIYRYLYITLIVTEIIWMYNLYKSERSDFFNQEKNLIKKAIICNNFQYNGILSNPELFDYQYNPQEKTINLIRHNKKTTFTIKKEEERKHIIEQLLYDLRNSRWNLDTLNDYYRSLSSNTSSVTFRRRDSMGNVFEYTNVPQLTNLIPTLYMSIPLGITDKHSLDVWLEYPWHKAFKNCTDWLIIAFLSTLLVIYLGFHLSKLALQRQLSIRFQREEIQYLLHKLYPHLRKTAQQEEILLTQQGCIPTKETIDLLKNNSNRYSFVLRSINVLLNRIIASSV